MPRDPRPALAIAAALLALLSFIDTELAAAGTYCPEIVGTVAKEVASADFNHDGYADFAVTTEPNAVVIVLGQAGPRPTSRLGAIPTGGAVNGIVAGDLNGDGNADLVVAQPTGGAIRVMLGHGDGTFSFSDPIDAGSNPGRPMLGDLDGDGDLDIALLSGIATLDPSELSIFLNNGDGTFAPRQGIGIPATSSSQTDLAVGDIDGDGDADAVVLVSDLVSGAIEKRYVIIRSNGDGTFASSTTPSEGVSTSAIALGDVNHDGRADLVAKDGYLGIGGPGPRRLATYFGRADGTFDAPIDAPMTVVSVDGRLALADLNGDGNLDAVMMPGPFFTFSCGLGTVDVALGDGAGSFAEMPALRTGGSTTAVAISDATGDGILDLATTGNECGTMILNPGNGDGTFRSVMNEARAFVDNNNDIIRLNANKSTWCLNLEPVGGTFDLVSELQWVELRSPDTGTVTTIARDFSKPIVITDGDGNGIPDARICFSKTQLRSLFANINGRQTVTLTVHAEVGAPTCAADALLTVDVIPGGNGKKAAAFVRPDLDGRRWTLSYQAERPASARLRLYDVSGRLVRTLALPNAVAGWNDVPLDGRDDQGRLLHSGVFFYRVEAGSEPIAGKLVIAR